MEAILEKNKGLVNKLASRYFCSSVDWDDLIQAGNMGLVEAERRFNPNLGASFFTYAYFWVRKRIKEEVAKAHLVVVPAAIQAKRDKEQSEETCVTCSMESCVAFLADKAQDKFTIDLNTKYMRCLLKTLSERENKVLSLRLSGYSLTEVGQSLEISRERVRQIERSVILKLKKII